MREGSDLKVKEKGRELGVGGLIILGIIIWAIWPPKPPEPPPEPPPDDGVQPEVSVLSISWL